MVDPGFLPWLRDPIRRQIQDVEQMPTARQAPMRARTGVSECDFPGGEGTSDCAELPKE